MTGRHRLKIIMVLAILSTPLSATDWTMFRGPNGSGVSDEKSSPIRFGPEQNLLWKASLPSGQSSPVLWGDRLFLTAFDEQEERLEVWCLHRADGSVLWRRQVHTDAIEPSHAVAGPATATPAVDAERVYVYFGSHGLTAFDHDGEVVWDFPMPMPKMGEGSGVSPLLIGDVVVLNRDEMESRYTVGIDARTGDRIWRTDHPSEGASRGGHSTPIAWRGLIVIHRLNEVVALDPQDGARKWRVGLNTKGETTPAANNEMLYVAAFNNGGEPDLMGNIPNFETALSRYDEDGDGGIDLDEFPDHLHFFKRPEARDIPAKDLALSARRFAPFADRDKDGKLDGEEWEGLERFMKLRPHGLTAIRPEGAHATTEGRVVWQVRRAAPEVPSPLVYGEQVYMVKNGGILTSVDALTGEVIYRGRVGAPGDYFASPIAAAGRVYVASAEGVVVVVKAGAQLDVLARNDLEEEIQATPALSDGVLIVRTAKHLYAFSE